MSHTLVLCMTPLLNTMQRWAQLPIALYPSWACACNMECQQVPYILSLGLRFRSRKLCRSENCPWEPTLLYFHHKRMPRWVRPWQPKVYGLDFLLGGFSLYGRPRVELSKLYFGHKHSQLYSVNTDCSWRFLCAKGLLFRQTLVSDKGAWKAMASLYGGGGSSWDDDCFLSETAAS